MRIALTILLMLICFIAGNLGMDYINFGHGLHPAIAFTLVGSCLAWLFILIKDDL